VLTRRVCIHALESAETMRNLAFAQLLQFTALRPCTRCHQGSLFWQQRGITSKRGEQLHSGYLLAASDWAQQMAVGPSRGALLHASTSARRRPSSTRNRRRMNARAGRVTGAPQQLLRRSRLTHVHIKNPLLDLQPSACAGAARAAAQGREGGGRVRRASTPPATCTPATVARLSSCHCTWGDAAPSKPSQAQEGNGKEYGARQQHQQPAGAAAPLIHVQLPVDGLVSPNGGAQQRPQAPECQRPQGPGSNLLHQVRSSFQSRGGSCPRGCTAWPASHTAGTAATVHQRTAGVAGARGIAAQMAREGAWRGAYSLMGGGRAGAAAVTAATHPALWHSGGESRPPLSETPAP